MLRRCAKPTMRQSSAGTCTSLRSGAQLRCKPALPLEVACAALASFFASTTSCKIPAASVRAVSCRLCARAQHAWWPVCRPRAGAGAARRSQRHSRASCQRPGAGGAGRSGCHRRKNLWKPVAGAQRSTGGAARRPRAAARHGARRHPPGRRRARAPGGAERAHARARPGVWCAPGILSSALEQAGTFSKSMLHACA